MVERDRNLFWPGKVMVVWQMMCLYTGKWSLTHGLSPPGTMPGWGFPHCLPAWSVIASGSVGDCGCECVGSVCVCARGYVGDGGWWVWGLTSAGDAP